MSRHLVLVVLVFWCALTTAKVPLKPCASSEPKCEKGFECRHETAGGAESKWFCFPIEQQEDRCDSNRKCPAGKICLKDRVCFQPKLSLEKVFEGGSYGQIALVNLRDPRGLNNDIKLVVKAFDVDSEYFLRMEQNAMRLAQGKPGVIQCITDGVGECLNLQLTKLQVRRFFAPTIVIRDVISMEYCENGDALDDVTLEPNVDTTGAKRLLAMLDTARALDSLHKDRVIHKDIKAENTFFGCPLSKSVATLADLGLAQLYAEEPLGTGCLITEEGDLLDLCGTPGYIPPELFLSHEAWKPSFEDFKQGKSGRELAETPYKSLEVLLRGCYHSPGYSADVFSLANVFIVLLFKTIAMKAKLFACDFPELLTLNDIYGEPQKDWLSLLMEFNQERIPEDDVLLRNADLVKLIHKMLSWNPEDRPSPSAVALQLETIITSLSEQDK